MWLAALSSAQAWPMAPLRNEKVNTSFRPECECKLDEQAYQLLGSLARLTQVAVASFRTKPGLQYRGKQRPCTQTAPLPFEHEVGHRLPARPQLFSSFM